MNEACAQKKQKKSWSQQLEHPTENYGRRPCPKRIPLVHITHHKCEGNTHSVPQNTDVILPPPTVPVTSNCKHGSVVWTALQRSPTATVKTDQCPSSHASLQPPIALCTSQFIYFCRTVMQFELLLAGAVHEAVKYFTGLPDAILAGNLHSFFFPRIGRPLGIRLEKCLM